MARAVPITGFVIAAAAGVAILSRRRARRERGGTRVVLAVEALFVAAVLLAGTMLRNGGSLRSGSVGYYLVALLAVTATGLQTSVLRSVGGASVSTIFVTGVLSSTAQDAIWSVSPPVPDATGGATEDAAGARRRLTLHAGIWASYLAGAAVGAILESRLRFVALVLPLGVLLVAARCEPLVIVAPEFAGLFG